MLSITARSASLKGKVKQPTDRHWEKTTLGQVLGEAASEAGLRIKVHPSLASRPLEYEAQDNESFLAFADRLAREHVATFAIKGTRAGLVPRNRSVSATGKPLPTIVITRGMVIAASGLTPATDRPRFKKKKAAYRRRAAEGLRFDHDRGEPTAEPEGTAVIQLRAGVDGSYTIASITDTLDRGSGYTTQISLGNPQGSAGTDSR
ncbi:hypothetical protein CK215_26735 [Mesorhizobium sp. WSM3864]|uniref:hypothetical protein n=1 Tax=Mesorhizobium sp. WSM3864 TaxID=2029404 RepID=UPI000BAF4333|nr:hypothetical protein [Mesorhizobium sp. WSM3864]PBB89634.1 hypothetical protein CK215_26735 [Mesorhizobium sp. WSM3864]